ncbi:hypothetical protein KAK06_15350 [Ideonella sp. 4Y11]|uniref:Uncharacterized protein n=1 Tax=Ideonella aquatica TaxID=2824119 RepID=A0A941BRF6_9BURK|nr:hypothetical protein [Ideonella aquatica]MBQ0960330.1 hypothetical protein [Ideonella aquatica]
MVYALSWSLVAAVFVGWSLLVWAVHALATWSLNSAGALTGGTEPGSLLSLPAWLADWVPLDVVGALGDLVAWLGPWVDATLSAAPALATGLTVLSWVLWGLVSLLLVLLGAGLHGLIALWRRRAPTLVAGSAA